MTETLRTVLSGAIVRILRPLVRLALRNGLSYQAFTELLKWVYADVAGRHFGIPGRKTTKSRIAVITGLTRREVDRLVNMQAPIDDAPGQRYNRAARVLSGWADDAQFHDADGKPAELELEGGESSFAELVRLYSGNQPTRAVLDELIRVKSVERTEDGAVRLLRAFYEPVRGKEEATGLDILGVAASDLISTIDHNIRSREDDVLFFQQEVYEYIDPEQLEEVAEHLRKQCHSYADRTDRFLSSRARTGEEGMVRMGLGLYFFRDDDDDTKEP